MTAAPGSPPRVARAKRAMVDADGGIPLSDSTGTRSGKAGSRARKRPIWVKLLALLVGLALVTVGYFAVRAVRALDRIERDESMLVGDYPGRPGAGLGSNYLVLANHTESASAKADLFMLVHVNRARDKVFLVSLPRDFYLKSEDGTPRDLQDLYARGGASSLLEVLESTFDTRIDHVARVDYKGFIQLTEQLGGVVVDNPIETTTPAGVHFAKGPIVVAGEHALEYVSDSSSIPNRSLVLAQRQRSVLRATVLKILSPETMLNPIMLGSVLQVLAKGLAVDSQLTTPNIVLLAASMRVGQSSDIVAAQAPILGTTTGYNGSPATLPSPALVADLSAALRNDTMDTYWAAHPE